MDRTLMSRVLCSMLAIALVPAFSQAYRSQQEYPFAEDMESSGEIYTGDGQGSGLDPLPPLESIVEREITKNTVESVISETKRALAELPEKGFQELTDTVTILERASQVPSIPQQTVQNVLEIVDGLSVLPSAKLTLANTQINFSNRLIKSVEDLGRRIDLGDKSSTRLVSSTTALEVWDVSKTSDVDDAPMGLRLRVTDERKTEGKEEKEEEGGGFLSARRLNVGRLETIHKDDGEVSATSDTDISITLNSSFLSGILKDNNGQDVRMWMTVFSETSLFKQAEERTLSDPERKKEVNRRPGRRLNSKVISASISANGVPVSHFSPSVVTSVFLPIERVDEGQRTRLSRCVFWDVEQNEGRGGWSGNGCRYHRTLHGRDVCVCDHLTNFAVLLDFYGRSDQPSEIHQAVLSLMSVVGLCFSICGLFCTILSFICIKKMHKVLPKKVLVNLATAMLASWVVFLAGFSGASGSEAGCITVAALLHYFILATFLWMLVEGVLQYLLLVKVHGHVRWFLLKASAFAWGIPAIPVATILAVDLKLYRGYDRYCWMSLTPFYYSFLLPVGVVLVSNLIIYILVVVSICRTRGRSSTTNTSVKGSNRSKGRGVSVRASFACFVILGLSWLLAFLAVSDARLVFQYLFTLTTTLQGLLLFLLFTARDPLVQEFWRDRVHRGLALVTRTSSRTPSSSSTARTSSLRKATAPASASVSAPDLALVSVPVLASAPVPDPDPVPDPVHDLEPEPRQGREEGEGRGGEEGRVEVTSCQFDEKAGGKVEEEKAVKKAAEKGDEKVEEKATVKTEKAEEKAEEKVEETAEEKAEEKFEEKVEEKAEEKA